MTSTRFNKIVFADDFFRSSDNTTQSWPANLRFLSRSFSLPAARLGIPCEDMGARSDGGKLDIAAMMHVLSLPCSADGWAKAGIADLEPLAKAGLLSRFSAGTLVIGWGMPASLLRFIDGGGASFLDLEIAPERFGSHLAFHARSNDPQIKKALAAFQFDEEEFWNQAAILRGYFARRGSPAIFDKNLHIGLFCAQTKLDLALVQDGKMARPIDALEAVRRLADEVDVLAIKPHPYESDLSHLEELASHLPNATWTDANIYAMLCADNLRFICGLSSGALHEAGYFMVRSVRLIMPDRNNRAKLPAGCSQWMSVNPGIFSLKGMTMLCETPAPTQPKSLIHRIRHALQLGKTPDPTSPNAASMDEYALDHILGLRWGLNRNDPGLRLKPAATRGHTYAMTVGQAAVAWLEFGWHWPEANGVWTAGKRASIVIPLPAGTFANSDAVSVTLHGQVFPGLPARPTTVRAWINGQHASAQTRVGNPPWEDARFGFSHTVGTIGKACVLLIELEIIDPQIPRDCGINEDTRLLGFFLQQIAIST